jgi:hypothetical protein
LPAHSGSQQCYWRAGKPSLANDRFWPGAGAAKVEINATLPSFRLFIFQFRLWRRLSGKRYVRKQSEADGELSLKLKFRLKVCNGAGCTSAMQRGRALAQL